MDELKNRAKKKAKANHIKAFATRDQDPGEKSTWTQKLRQNFGGNIKNPEARIDYCENLVEVKSNSIALVLEPLFILEQSLVNPGTSSTTHRIDFCGTFHNFFH